MIKFIVAALWLCAVTAGSIFYSYSAASHNAANAEAAPAFFGGLDYVKGDMISVPNIRHGAIQGYFLARFVYTAEPSRLKQLSIPIQSLLLDEVYSYIYSAPPIDPDNPDAFDLEGLKAGVRDSINKRVGETLIHDVMVEQVEYVPKDEIRNNSVSRRITPSKYLSTTENADPGKKASSSGH